MQNSEIVQKFVLNGYFSKKGNRNLPISHIDFSPDGQYLAYSSTELVSPHRNEAAIILWDIGSEKIIMESHFDDDIRYVFFSKDGKNLIFRSLKKIFVWNIKANNHLHVFRGHKDEILNVAINRDRSLLVSAGLDNQIILWDIINYKKYTAIKDDYGWVNSVKVSNDTNYLAVTGQLGKTIWLYDINSRTCIEKFSSNGATGDDTTAFARDNKHIAYVSDSTVIIRNFRNQIDSKLPHPGKVFSISFSPNGKYFATGSVDRIVRIWDVASGKNLYQFTGHPSSVSCLVFSPDSKILISGSKNDLRVWDYGLNLQIAHHNFKEGGYVNQIKFDNSGEFFAFFNSVDTDIMVFSNPSGGREIQLWQRRSYRGDNGSNHLRG